MGRDELDYWCAFFAAIALLGVWLWRLVLRRVQAMSAYAHDVAHGVQDVQASVRFGAPAFSEVGQAVRQINTTLQARNCQRGRVCRLTSPLVRRF